MAEPTVPTPNLFARPVCMSTGERIGAGSASAGPDPTCTCLWCGKKFGPRQDGGKRQRFCAEPCRRHFAKAALAWVMDAVATGKLSREDLRNGPPATRRCATKANEPLEVVG
jgi:hypothetical protein